MTAHEECNFTLSCSESLSNLGSRLDVFLLSNIDLEDSISSSSRMKLLFLDTGAVTQCRKPSRGKENSRLRQK